eukprot:13644111-Alexandrium_andersonii.AAC.1
MPLHAEQLRRDPRAKTTSAIWTRCSPKTALGAECPPDRPSTRGGPRVNRARYLMRAFAGGPG